MPAYLIARVQVNDSNRYAEYTRVTPGLVAQHGGKFLVRGGAIQTLEGEPESRRLVVIEFASMSAARAFYDSPGYKAARQLRAGAAQGDLLIAEGC